MKFGVTFPQTEIGNDPGAIREFAQVAEELGYEHILIAEHVLGADPVKHPILAGPYTNKTPFHEPFVLLGYLAGVTSRIKLTTGVVVLPQRQTALVAKQAAAVDVLTNGRLRLGVGVGWNRFEYQALGEDFHTRGRRLEEQVALLRRLWTEESVDFAGKWHTVTGAGINPMPVQRPIPIWMGGHAEPVLRRVGRLADGWIPMMQPDDAFRAAMQRIHDYAREAGRDPASIEIRGSVNIALTTKGELAAAIPAWRDIGATQIDAITMFGGLDMPQKHIDAIRRFKEFADSLS
ncbi:MAG: LLM class F420-dependent oxidoreductase [Chloroflexota bacterium]|nr:LLM class F420-dependent oxidoreductase [Chloroflexota bacterium]MDE2969919.1 LLM class F420-dependent oxidoreductase [Chloroflexota bacterium]